MEHQKTCIICGKQFIAKNARAAYCSNACKQSAFKRAHRVAAGEEDIYAIRNMRPVLPDPIPVTLDNIAQAVARTKGDSTALRCYAPSCAPMVCSALLHVSDAIDKAMEEVGL